MSAPIKQNSFVGGEIAPFLYGRPDFARYESSLRTMRNFMAMRHGGATQRPGTMYVGTAQNGGSAIRLIPFIFNETGTGQSYLLEFGNLYVGFYQNGAVVVNGGNPYTIVSPYAQADLSSLQFAQSADIITITHPSYPVYELARVGATNWTLTQVTFIPTGASASSFSLAGTAGTPVPWSNYTITAVNQLGEEIPSGTQTGNAGSTLANPTSGTPITVSWTAATGAVSYRVYRSTIQGVPGNFKLGPWGLVGQVTAISFLDTGTTPDFTQSIPVTLQSFGSSNNYPSTVGFVQQRRAFGNTNNNPLGVWLSQPGDFYNFEASVPSKDSDAIAFSLAGEEVNAVQHILELKFMLLLSAGAELFIQGNGNGTVTPSAINASTQSQYGSSALRPLKIGDVCLFNQALGSFIRDFSFDFAIDGYRGNDITVFASHLFEGYQLVDWAYQKIPDSIIWVARSDGALLGCTYVREQQVLAWHRHDFTNGSVENVCAIPENGNYAVYLCIKRTINGSTVRYIERMSSRIWSDEISATYLDCYSSYNGVNAGSTTMTLLTPGGGFKSDSTAYQQQITLQASAGFFTSNMVGQVITISDANFAAGIGSQGPDGTLSFLGPEGNQIQCFIQAFISATQVTITPSGVVPSTLQNIAVTTWAQAVKTVSGLGYLQGQQVSIWADRFVVGSPLNKQISSTYTVPASGILTLDKWYSTVYVGLPMTADLQTLDLETSFGETILSRRKRTNRFGMFVYKTRTLFAGSEDPDINQNNSANDPLFELFEMERGDKQVGYDTPPELTTDQDYIPLESHWNRGGRVFIRNVDPVPCTLLSLGVFGESPAPSPNYEKA